MFVLDHLNFLSEYEYLWTPKPNERDMFLNEYEYLRTPKQKRKKTQRNSEKKKL